MKKEDTKWGKDWEIEGEEEEVEAEGEEEEDETDDGGIVEGCDLNAGELEEMKGEGSSLETLISPNGDESFTGAVEGWKPPKSAERPPS